MYCSHRLLSQIELNNFEMLRILWDFACLQLTKEKERERERKSAPLLPLLRQLLRKDFGNSRNPWPTLLANPVVWLAAWPAHRQPICHSRNIQAQFSETGTSIFESVLIEHFSADFGETNESINCNLDRLQHRTIGETVKRKTDELTANHSRSSETRKRQTRVDWNVGNVP